MRRVWGIALLALSSCAQESTLVFVPASDPRVPDARTLILVAENERASRIAVVVNLPGAGGVSSQPLDALEDAVRLYAFFYTCDADTLELPLGPVGVSQAAGRRLMSTPGVQVRDLENGDWRAVDEVPIDVARLHLELTPLPRTSPLAPCLSPSPVAVLLPADVRGESPDLRWLAPLEGDRVLAMTKYGQLITATPEGATLTEFDARYAFMGHGAFDGADSWWALSQDGIMFRGSLTSTVVQQHPPLLATSDPAWDNDGGWVYAEPGSSAVYVWTHLRTLERCVPERQLPCTWEALGSIPDSPRETEFVRMTRTSEGELLATGYADPLFRWRDGRVELERPWGATNAAQVVATDVPGFGRVAIAELGQFAVEVSDGEWSSDDARFDGLNQEVRARFLQPTERGFLYGGRQGIVHEYESSPGACEDITFPGAVDEIEEVIESESGYWFRFNKQTPPLFFLPKKSPICRQ